MNKQNINKINLFFMGLKSRFSENNNIFQNIKVTFKTGLKEFKAIGTYENGDIKYNFNGVTKIIDFNHLLEEICKEVEIYENMDFVYKERGNQILICANNKNVTMKSIEVIDDEVTNANDQIALPSSYSSKKSHEHLEGTSTLLNRDYYVKVGKADKLLKEINIMTKDGKIKNDKIRKYNQIDHYVELLDKVFDSFPQNKTINILDCGCGKSYLSFVLNYYLTEVKKIKCHFIGLDYSKGVILASKKMSNNLGYRNMEFHAIDIKDYAPDKQIHMVLSLHACDTATDMALALGIKVNAEVIIAVPCCHRELLNQYSYEPFKNILKHGILKERMANILTEGMRATMLQAKGYDVSMVEYISPLETPKNLMIRAIKTKQEDPVAMKEYLKLMKELNAEPALYRFLQEWC